MRRRSLSDDERVLWSTVTRGIAPLTGRKRVEHAAAAASAETKAKAKPTVPSPAVTAPPQRVRPPPLAPIDRRTKQRLARGVTEIGGRLDLHGLTQAEAH